MTTSDTTETVEGKLTAGLAPFQNDIQEDILERFVNDLTLLIRKLINPKVTANEVFVFCVTSHPTKDGTVQARKLIISVANGLVITNKLINCPEAKLRVMMEMIHVATEVLRGRPFPVTEIKDSTIAAWEDSSANEAPIIGGFKSYPRWS